jgi:hypothetical protein
MRTRIQYALFTEFYKVFLKSIHTILAKHVVEKKEESELREEQSAYPVLILVGVCHPGP